MANYTRELNLACLPLREKYKTSKFLNLHKKYRSHFEIMALIVEAMKGDGAAPYCIMRHVGINHVQLKKYLGSLTYMGFIEMDIKEGQVLYRAADKGLDFLRQYYVLLGMLLSARERNKPTNVVYATEYYSSNGL